MRSYGRKTMVACGVDLKWSYLSSGVFFHEGKVWRVPISLLGCVSGEGNSR